MRQLKESSVVFLGEILQPRESGMIDSVWEEKRVNQEGLFNSFPSKTEEKLRFS